MNATKVNLATIVPSAAKACDACPWRKTNQGKKHAHGFYTKTNLTRLWNQIRRGNGMQSCHPTDPNHPDHGAKPDSTPRECSGSVLVVLHEVKAMASEDRNITKETIAAYQAARAKRGLTKSGILWWVVKRIQLGGVPFVGAPKLPAVAEDDAIGLPSYLAEG